MSQTPTPTYKTLKQYPPGKGGFLAGIPLYRWSDGRPGGGYAQPDPNFHPAHTPDGQPDIQGVWSATTTTASRTVEADPGDNNGGFFAGKTGSLVVDPPDGMIPYQPWTHDKIQDYLAHFISPMAACLPTGLPRQMYYSDYQIIQKAGEVVLINEHLPNFRHIPLDGRPHIASSVKLWMGDSRGHWEGNTLVVDVSNLNDQTMLSAKGDLHSRELHVTERLTRIDANTIQYEAVIEDPVVYERPWKMAFPLTRLPSTFKMLEENCAEGNKSIDAQMQLGRRFYTGLEDVK